MAKVAEIDGATLKKLLADNGVDINDLSRELGYSRGTQRTMTMFECREISYDGTAFDCGEHYHICQECLRRLTKNENKID